MRWIQTEAGGPLVGIEPRRSPDHVRDKALPPSGCSSASSAQSLHTQRFAMTRRNTQHRLAYTALITCSIIALRGPGCSTPPGKKRIQGVSYGTERTRPHPAALPAPPFKIEGHIDVSFKFLGIYWGYDSPKSAFICWTVTFLVGQTRRTINILPVVKAHMEKNVIWRMCVCWSFIVLLHLCCNSAYHIYL